MRFIVLIMTGGYCALACVLFLSIESDGQDLANIGNGKPFMLSGAATVEGRYQASTSAQLNIADPLGAYLMVSPTASIYDLQLPFTFYVSTTGNQFQQPFNEFGVSPKYKWITVHGGYRTMEISPYTLSGVRWLGGGMEMNPGYFRMAGMAGQFRKAAAGDSALGVVGTCERQGYAFKLGAGGRNNFLDVNFFHATDGTGDGISPTDPLGALPQENTVVSLHPRLAFRGFTVEGEAAGALLNRDTHSPAVSDRSIPQEVEILHRINASTRASLAVKANTAYRNRIVRLNLKYLRILPGFQSLGAGYLANDKEEIAFSPAIRVTRDIRYSGSIGFRRNNLDGMRSQTSRRLIWSSGVDWQIVEVAGFDIRYSNYSTTSSDGLEKVADSLRSDNTAHSVSLSPRFTLGSSDHPHSVASSMSLDIYYDRNPLTGPLADSRTFNGMISHTAKLAGTWSASESGSLTRATGYQYDNTVWGLTLGVSNTLLDNQVSLSMGATTTVADGQNETTVQVFPVINGQYRYTSKDEFRAATQISKLFAQQHPRTDAVTTIGYSRTF